MSIDFFQNGLCFYCDLSQRQLQEYGDFHERTEFAWQKQNEVLEQEITEILKKYPDSDHEEIVDSYGWELHLHQSKYPDIHRTALVIAIYIFLEEQLAGLCGTISGCVGSGLQLDDLRGQGVERALLFLSKVASFDFGKVPSFPFVKQVNKLRNKMVHAGGILPNDPRDGLNVFVATTPGLRGNPGNSVRIETEFVSHLIAQLILFFGDLNKQVQEFMNKAQQSVAADRGEDAAPAER